MYIKLKRTRLRKESKKHREQRIAYERERKKWLEDHPGCQFELIPSILCNSVYGCSVHHKMGRGKYLSDPKFFMTACPVHHTWIEDNKKEARKRGYILYR